MVRYLSELIDEHGTPAYQLPLHFSRTVDEFRLRVEVVQGETQPLIVSGGLPGFKFGRWRESYLAELVARDVAPTQNLVIALPRTDQRRVLLEKSADGATWFTIHDLPPIPEPRTAAAPARIGILWDASASRAAVDHERELETLHRFFARFPTSNIQVEPLQERSRSPPALHYSQRQCRPVDGRVTPDLL
jgi:hypothetical protein